MGESNLASWEKFPVQAPFDASASLGTQPHYMAACYIQVENWGKKKWLRLGEWDCPLDNGSKLLMG